MTQQSEPDIPLSNPSASDSDPAGGGQAINQTWDRMRTEDQDADHDSAEALTEDSEGSLADDATDTLDQGSEESEECEEVAGDDPDMTGRLFDSADDRTQI